MAVQVAVLAQAAAVVDALRNTNFQPNFTEHIMKKIKFNPGALALAAAVSMTAIMAASPALAQDQTQDRTQLRTQEQIYGSQLMTPAEREAHWAKLRNMKTEEERNAFRLQHHEQMQERARAKGIQLPEVPLMRRSGPGAGGPGPGPGPGPGVMKKM